MCGGIGEEGKGGVQSASKVKNSFRVMVLVAMIFVGKSALLQVHRISTTQPVKVVTATLVNRYCSLLASHSSARHSGIKLSWRCYDQPEHVTRQKPYFQ